MRLGSFPFAKTVSPNKLGSIKRVSPTSSESDCFRTTIKAYANFEHLSDTRSHSIQAAIRKWLTKVDETVSHERAQHQHYESTGRWFVEGKESGFQDWLNKKGKAFQWLRGIGTPFQMLLANCVLANHLLC